MPEASVQVLVESVVELEFPAVKIDEIRAVVRDLTCSVIPDKVIFQGTLHKQIFYVRTDSVVVHQAEDIRFAGFVDLPGALPGMACRINAIIEFIGFELIDETTLEQRVVIRVNVATEMVPAGILVPAAPEPVTFLGGQTVAAQPNGNDMFMSTGIGQYRCVTPQGEWGVFSTLSGPWR